MTNDEKVKEYQKKKIAKYSILIFSFLTIILESLALFQMISYLWGLIPFFITYMIKYFYQGNSLNKKKKNDQKKWLFFFFYTMNKF